MSPLHETLTCKTRTAHRRNPAVKGYCAGNDLHGRVGQRVHRSHEAHNIPSKERNSSPMTVHIRMNVGVSELAYDGVSKPLK